MVETKRELRVKRGISAESPKKAAIPFTDCGLYLWCRRRDSNSYRRGLLPPQDSVSTSSTTSAILKSYPAKFFLPAIHRPCRLHLQGTPEQVRFLQPGLPASGSCPAEALPPGSAGQQEQVQNIPP